jgi:hypothetical protein
LWILRCDGRWFCGAANAGVLMNALEEEQQHNRRAKSKETSLEVIIFRFMRFGDFFAGVGNEETTIKSFKM